MSKFKQKEKRTVPQPPSGSLSDIVFMLLFFFMVTTTMRETETQVTVKLPEATEVAKLERKDLAAYINIGTPIKALQAKYGNSSTVQLNDKIMENDIKVEIPQFITQHRGTMDEVDQSYMTVVIKADENTRMGIVTDVKQELRKVSALKIMYTARKSEK